MRGMRCITVFMADTALAAFDTAVTGGAIYQDVNITHQRKRKKLRRVPPNSVQFRDITWPRATLPMRMQKKVLSTLPPD